MERTGKAAEYFYRACQHWDLNEFKEAAAGFGEGIKLLPDDAESYGYRGECYLNLGQPEKALEDFNKAISLDPKEAEYYDSRGNLYIMLNEMKKADADLEKAAELNPDKAGKYYYTFGCNVEYRTGDKDEAAKYFKKSVEHGDLHGMAKEMLKKWGAQLCTPSRGVDE